jgi:DNA-binding NarL/FixJ family response regulator
MAIRVLVVDADAESRARLVRSLQENSDVQVAGEAEEWSDAVRRVEQLEPVVILLDLGLPNRGAVFATRQILQPRPAPAVCLLAASEEIVSRNLGDLVIAIRLGARGYLIKTVDAATLSMAVRTLADGGVIVSPFLARGLHFAFNARKVGRSVWLAPYERRILELVQEGIGESDIAQRFPVSESAVRGQLRTILDKYRYDPEEPPDVLGDGVPRRPVPPGLAATAAASPEPATDDSAPEYHFPRWLKA